jgi:hypothetical protein
MIQVASVNRRMRDNLVASVARCIAGGVRSLLTVAASVCEQDGDEHVGQPVLVGVWAAA